MEKDLLIQKANEYILLEKTEVFKNQIRELLAKNDLNELNERFYTELEFGTGGIRGIIGGGYNRLNAYIIRKTTQGLANYIKKAFPAGQKASVVIAYDSRRFSIDFARESACVLCANGITTYLFSELRPTPELSFAVRTLSATAGIVITASHNPAEYNGYKVYWSDGGQIIAPHDKEIVAEVGKVKGSAIASVSKEEAIASGLLIMIGEQVDAKFIGAVKRCSLRPGLIKEKGKNITAVYTPLNGAGAMPVERTLSEMGIKVVFVEEQKAPDGNFPTLAFPNPEEASAMKLALELAKKVKADIVLGTDPDADRLGIAVPDGGDFKLITGNQLGSLLLDYILSTRQELGSLPHNGIIVKTIVTTELQAAIARDYNVRCVDVLTGFKYIAEKIRQFESEKHGPVYLFGGEESYGYLVHTAARDKDAVSAATLAVEMALYHVSRGSTVIGRLKELYEKYGYFEETQVSRYFKGESGLGIIANLMAGLRAKPPSAIGGTSVVAVKDYKDRTTFTLSSAARVSDIDLPPSNVLQFFCDDASIITARPSGTEPKIKFYASCRGPVGLPFSQACDVVGKRIAAIKLDLNRIIDGVSL
jgi:phosphoglucomutase